MCSFRLRYNIIYPLVVFCLHFSSRFSPLYLRIAVAEVHLRGLVVNVTKIQGNISESNKKVTYTFFYSKTLPIKYKKDNQHFFKLRFHMTLQVYMHEEWVNQILIFKFPTCNHFLVNTSENKAALVVPKPAFHICLYY